MHRTRYFLRSEMQGAFRQAARAEEGPSATFAGLEAVMPLMRAAGLRDFADEMTAWRDSGDLDGVTAEGVLRHVAERAREIASEIDPGGR